MFVFKAAVVGSGRRGARDRGGDRGRRRRGRALVDGVRFDGLGDVDLVIEAMPERMEVKHRVFAELDAATPGHAILATTTAGLSITEIGEITLRPDKVVGLHFAGPRVVEVVESDDTVAGDRAGRRELRPAAAPRRAVRCAECPGFVVNRVLASAAAEQRRVDRALRRAARRLRRPLPARP